MDFAWTAEQSEKFQAAAEFAKRSLEPGVRERERRQEFSRELWRKCAEFGILGLPVAKEYGGLQADAQSTALTMEGLGYGCGDNGLLFALGAQLFSVQTPVAEFGSAEQKAKYLPGLISGACIGAHAMSEPESGSDALSLRTRAEYRDGSYFLNGTKTMITSAPDADLALVFASTAPEKGRWGISAFLVESSCPGYTATRNLEKMGLRTSSLGEIVLADCRVPEAARLGPEGAGASIFSFAMERERSGILAVQVGAMRRQLETCVRYARERQQFGQSIGKFGSVANRLADMRVRLSTARLLLYQVAWLHDQGRSAPLEAAEAKLYISECFMQSSLDAVRIHGGYGYLTEYEVERDLRDAVGGTLYSGTSDLQRVVIARLLGL